eukprot:CAMPEP_0202761722 /NCGR_PEP_ID=MMETSP1388-20130828/20349_1 /ASSEMBLY_ACC=CAM_ASM_000864 /TAXON_ID=37098 /ORGANISM="Isochrysis sp, Strain CCMP1244" /LENGTH=67 /DNA_ID=CAMNT_0049429875 /DNA_START=393 /DNA_END=596 /DNA_ORIENTATION=-
MSFSCVLAVGSYASITPEALCVMAGQQSSYFLSPEVSHSSAETRVTRPSLLRTSRSNSKIRTPAVGL